jgi:type VI secretion system secreted protein VgrG
MIDSIVQASARSGTPSQLLQGITGHPSYFLDVTGPANAKALSVVSFEAVERIGEPYRIAIELTHPEALTREDYLGRDARFTIAPAASDGFADSSGPSALRTLSRCITGFSSIKATRNFSSYRVAVQAHIARFNFVGYEKYLDSAVVPAGDAAAARESPDASSPNTESQPRRSRRPHE